MEIDHNNNHSELREFLIHILKIGGFRLTLRIKEPRHTLKGLQQFQGTSNVRQEEQLRINTCTRVAEGVQDYGIAKGVQTEAQGSH